MRSSHPSIAAEALPAVDGPGCRWASRQHRPISFPNDNSLAAYRATSSMKSSITASRVSLVLAAVHPLPDGRLTRLTSPVSSSFRNAPKVSLRLVDPFDEDFADMHTTRITSDVSPEARSFLNWRFSNVPGRQYLLLGEGSGPAALGGTSLSDSTTPSPTRRRLHRPEPELLATVYRLLAGSPSAFERMLTQSVNREIRSHLFLVRRVFATTCSRLPSIS